MSRLQCVVPDCPTPPRSAYADYCEKHYYRVRRHGSPDIVITRDQQQPPRSRPFRPGRDCAVPDCGKPAKALGLCPLHYDRMRRHGHTEPTRPFNPTTGICPVGGCSQPQDFDGMCKLHATRARRHGDPLIVIHQRDRNLPRGAEHHQWTGDAVTYFAMHLRLRKTKGRAADHKCVECGNPARQWSYDHADPDERKSNTGAYSANADHYVPRCVPCHKKFDLALKVVTA